MAEAQKDGIVRQNYEIRVDAQDLSRIARNTQVQRVCIEEEINAPRMISLRLAVDSSQAAGKPSAQKRSVSRVDTDFLDRFSLGAEFKAALLAGREDGDRVEVAGRIASIEPHYDARTRYIDVRGYDALYELRFGTKRRAFLENKDSALARELAGEAGLSAEVEDTGTVHPYLYQNNQSNYEFLLERALRIDYEISVDGKTLRFKPSAESEASEVTLILDKDLVRFDGRMHALSQGSEVSVRGWSFRKKATVNGRARRGDDAVTASGRRKTGFQRSQSGFESSQAAIIDEPVVDDQDAERIARAIYRRAQRNFVQAEGECHLAPGVRAGRNVRLEGLGDAFSGDYYVVWAQHIWETGAFSRTVFRARRSYV